MAAAVLAAGLLVGALPARAERREPLPKQLEGVGITEHPNAQLPLEATFTDDGGRPVRLGDLFRDGRPVVLALVYYRCPMLCNLVLDGMARALQGVDLEPGKDFELVAVSIDPRETPTLARAKKQNYVKAYGKPQTAAGWHFLTGPQPSITRVAQAVGFGYQYDAERNEYAHGAAFYVVTPDGRISRYLYGVQHEPRTVELSLVEASEGRIGTTIDRLILTCYHYDAASGSYVPAAVKLMRIGALLTLAALGMGLSLLWVRDRRRHRTA